MPEMTIRDEIKQTRPFRTPAQEAIVSLLRTTDQLRRHISKVVETREITMQQYNVLRILRGSHPEPLLTLEVADRMIEQAPGITRLLDRLETRGLIRRKRCEEDRRRVHCWITDQGLGILEDLEAPVNHADEVVSALGEKKITQLLRLLEEIREQL